MGTQLAALPVIGPLFGKTDEQEAAERYQQQIIDLLEKQYAGYSGDQELQALRQQAQGGLLPEDRAALMQALEQSGEFARGREGAIADEQARMGGAATTGLNMLAQQQAAQAQAQRLNQQQLGIGAIASQRAQQARLEFLRQKAVAAGQLAGGLGGASDFQGQVDAANRAAFGQILNTAGQIAAGYASSPSAPAAAAAKPAAPAGGQLISNPYENPGPWAPAAAPSPHPEIPAAVSPSTGSQQSWAGPSPSSEVTTDYPPRRRSEA